VWATRPGEFALKKSVGQAALEQRHAVIEEAVEASLPISIRRLCEVLQVNRAWYYAKRQLEPDTDREAERIALRDAIEDIILDFPGYGYRRVTRARHASWLAGQPQAGPAGDAGRIVVVPPQTPFCAHNRFQARIASLSELDRRAGPNGP
jgi:hypothetical protein